jgi:hypothetical protein
MYIFIFIFTCLNIYIYIDIFIYMHIYLHTIGATHESYPDYLLEFHIINVGKIKKSQIGFAVSASQTLTGVAKTGINWDKISPTMKAALWEQLFRGMLYIFMLYIYVYIYIYTCSI